MHAWDKSDSETEKQYQAFTQYLLLGPDRSIEKVGQKWSKSGATSRLQIWSSENNWVARAAAYDQFLAKDSIKAQIITNVSREVMAYKKRCLDTSALTTATVNAALSKVVPKIQKIETETLTVAELIAFTRALVSLAEFSFNIEATSIGVDRLAEALLHEKESDQDIS